MAEVFRVAPEATTSGIFMIRGQRSRWIYPNPNLSPEYCDVLTNVNVSEEGVAKSRFGYVKYSDTVIPDGDMPTGLWQGTFASGTTRQVVVTPDKAYSDPGGAAARSNITGSDFTGTNEDRFEFIFTKDKLVMNNAVDQVRTWTGSTSSNTTDLTGMPWTKCKGIFTHKNLMMAWGPTEGGTYFPTRVRWCDINRRTYEVDIGTWRADNRYEIYDGGPKIVAACDNWGTALIFKEDGLYPGEIVYDQLGHFDFQLGQPRRGFTPISKSLVVRPEFVAGVASEGLFIITPDLNFRIVNLDDLGAKKGWYSLNQERLKYAHLFVREKDHQVRVLVSSSGNTVGHDKVMVWDWETGDIWFDLITNPLNYARPITISSVEYDWFGSTNGYLYQANNIAYPTDDGTGYTWQIKMAPNDLGMPGKVKHILNIQTIFSKRVDASDVTMRVNIDQGRGSTITDTFNVGAEYSWDTGVSWNTGKLWPGAESRRADTFVNTMCETLAPEWTSSTPGSIVGYIVEYIPLEN